MSKLQPGDAAPDFELESDSGGLISLRNFAGKNLIIYFYPAAMTPGCSKQACDFRDNSALLKDAGYEVVGISPDKLSKLADFRTRDGLNFPLLSDPSKQVLDAYGAFGEKQLYGKTVVGVIRSTFLVSVDKKGKGTISAAWYGVKATGHVARLLKELNL